MLTELSNEIQNFTEISKQYIPTMLILVGILWAINVANWMTGSHLNRWGIFPRHARGLVGIFFAPLIHKNYTHLLFNSFPLFFLALFVMSLAPSLFYWVTAIIMLLSGIGVWCAGRYGIHIGASALIAGYFGYVLGSAYQQPTFTTFFCAAVAFYYFGSILLSLFPTDETVSWEGHLTGFLAGLIAIYLISHHQMLVSKIQSLTHSILRHFVLPH
ncbi:MAG: rhomboid family intramembrane serine protease [Candidatus Berkiellales bacterium]